MELTILIDGNNTAVFVLDHDIDDTQIIGQDLYRVILRTALGHQFGIRLPENLGDNPIIGRQYHLSGRVAGTAVRYINRTVFVHPDPPRIFELERGVVLGEGQLSHQLIIPVENDNVRLIGIVHTCNGGTVQNVQVVPLYNHIIGQIQIQVGN